jgi:hypothetical protein
MVDASTLIQISEQCRRGLARIAASPGSMFYGFPVGSCGPAAELVGRVLKEAAGYDGVYVCGSGHVKLEHNQTHAWYEVGNYVIDITHDQFPDTALAGWVFSGGTSWHAAFSDLDRRDGFCMPAQWPHYPHDGFAAIKQELALEFHVISSTNSR